MPLNDEAPDTLKMLGRLEAGVRRLAAKTKRLSAALEKVKQQRKLKPRNKLEPAQQPLILQPERAPAPATANAPPPRKRQALGRGLADLRRPRPTE